MGESLVADAGPLSAFGRIQRLELLPQVLGEVLVPHSVAVDRLADPSMHSSKRTFEALNQFAWRLHLSRTASDASSRCLTKLPPTRCVLMALPMGVAIVIRTE